MPQTADRTTTLHETAIQDMLGEPPSWLLHSGLAMIGLLLVVAGGLAAFISYPERVEAPFVLQSEKVPLAVHADITNYVEALLVGNNTIVARGDTLLVLRGDGDWSALRSLQSYLDRKAWTAGELTRELDYPTAIRQEVTRLGSLLKAKRSYLATNGTRDAVAALGREYSEAENLSISLNKQIALYDRELVMKDRNLDRTRQLVRESVISLQEAEVVEEQHITAQRQREAMISGDAQNRLRMNQLNQEILSIRLEHRERLADFDRQIREQVNAVRAAADRYSLNHFILADERGMIHWRPEVREGALVGGAEPLGYITSDDRDQSIVARLLLPPEGAGRAVVGNRVILDLAAYPSRQYGQLEGQVVDIDAVAVPDAQGMFHRTVTVDVPDDLVTAYGHGIPFQQNLTGTARIITEERTLFQRLFDQFLNFKNNR